MIKNILITGGNGYIGSHLCVNLLELGYNVTVVDNLINSSKKNLIKLKKISKKRFFFIMKILEKQKNYLTY